MPQLKLLIEKTCRVSESPHHCSMGCENLDQVGASAECKFWGDLTWDYQALAYKRLVPCVTAEYQYKRMEQLNEKVQAAPVVYACAAPGDGPPPAPESFDLVLRGYKLNSLLQATKEVRQVAALGLPESLELVKKSASKAEGIKIRWDITKDEAERLRNQLRDSGAHVEIVPSTL